MPLAFDGTRVPATLDPLPCGGTPQFDHGSGHAYRCDNCFAVIGSIGMPKSCKEALDASRAEKPRDYI